MYLFFNGRKDPHNQCLCRRYCTRSRQIDKVKRAISKKFEIKDLEELKYFLSVKIVTTTRMEQYGLDFRCLKWNN